MEPEAQKKTGRFASDQRIYKHGEAKPKLWGGSKLLFKKKKRRYEMEKRI